MQCEVDGTCCVFLFRCSHKKVFGSSGLEPVTLRPCADCIVIPTVNVRRVYNRCTVIISVNKEQALAVLVFHT